MTQQDSPPIVGIGASAGGVKALQALFKALPGDSGAAYVVVLHLAPDVRSELARILSNCTEMPVAQIEGETPLQANHVYVIAPDRRLRITDHAVASELFEEPRGRRAPIDLFFRSLAEQQPDCYAIILTGAGEDGALGVKSIKERGGIVLVQEPNEAEYPSMPRSAIAMQVADFVLPIRDLADRLAELLKKWPQVSADLQDLEEDNLRRILAHVRVRTGHDFSQYKRATILRRIARRAQVTRKTTLMEYYGYLRESPEEAQALLSDFLISVTSFFRDAKAYEALAKTAIPQIFAGREAGGTVRVWVAGCATGEEAYTIGMLLLEQAAQHQDHLEIQVFASDLDAGALAIGREGRYPATIEADVSEDRLHRFFLREGSYYRVRRELRDIVLFASHNVLKDPPFMRLDLVSCRNLLIYLDRDLQQQVCNTFHYALNPGGFLFLGSSESADQPAGVFRAVDREAKIFRSVPGSDARPALPLLLAPPHIGERRGDMPRIPPSSGGISDTTLHRQMLEKIAPPSMLVDDSHRALHLSESVGRYLHPAGGPASVNAADLVRPELRFDLRSALHRAFERGEATLTPPINVRFDGTARRVFMQVRPVLQEGDQVRHVLVIFIEGEAIELAPETGAAESREPADERVRQLEQELRLAQSRLRATREESEATNEELRAANEELQSINEEYRSTSEELETSKEELQSMNEELQTVNNELKLKLESISRAHNDLQNLMAATDLGTLFLDPALRIKRFTPRLTELFNITATDEGRPITDFTHQLQYEDLANDARAVLKDLVPIEREVKSRKDGWYLVRLRPYRTMDNRIDGVVATFVDITERRRTEEALRHETRLVDVSRAPIFVWDFDGGILQWNRGSERLYGYSKQEALGRNKAELLHTIVPGSSFEALRQSLLQTGIWSGELIHTAKDGRKLTIESQIELVVQGSRRLVLESTHDITGRKQWERRRELLLGELSHRVKNTLTIVQSMARQTLRSTASPQEFVKQFEGRIAALAHAHNLLLDSHWDGAELAALARAQMELHTGGNPDRFVIEGEPVSLPPDYATPFSLVLHELATNAAKYGALSAEGGRVIFSWQVSKADHNRHLSVTWRECDGPPVKMPGKQGFGSQLIENGLPGATVQRRFEPTGLVCTIEVDVPEAKTNGEDGEAGGPSHG